MLPWLHSLDSLRAHAAHDDANVRRWAVDTWIALYPDGDLVGLARMLLDADLEIRHDVAHHLALTHDLKWGPVLLKALDLAGPADKLTFVSALGKLADPRAVPALSRMLREARDGRALIGLIDALGSIRVEGSLRALCPLLDLLSTDDVFAGNLCQRILNLGRRADIADVVSRWRTWDRSDDSPVAAALTHWLGADADVVSLAARLPTSSVTHTLSRLTKLYPHAPVTPELVAVLQRAADKGPQAFLRALQGAMVGLITQRGDRLDLWITESLRPPAEDYRALIVGADALLGALAAVPCVPGHAHAEMALGFTAWLTVLVRTDEHQALEIATDREATARALFLLPSETVAPIITAQLASTPDRTAAWLMDIIDSEAPDVVEIRAGALLADLATGFPERVAPYAERLTRVLLKRASTPVAGALTPALRAAGPAAAAALAQHLHHETPDEVFEILSTLPLEPTYVALSEAWTTAVQLDLRIADALTNLGDARAVGVLAQGWAPGLVPLSAMLDALCTLHDLHPLERVTWRSELQLAESVRAVTHAQPIAES